MGDTAMTSLEVIYENGILRPLRPLELQEGTRLEVVMIKIADSPSRPLANSESVGEQP
jgi:predicted DNA-binding antitoxin AbrB/MazE fold protein